MTYNEQQWAGKLLDCLNQLGQQHTNAVLLSLDGAQSIKPYQRYPETAYCFAEDHWRAFYHSHGAQTGEAHEHGHFHFFTRLDRQDDWAHVVALGMDGYGQPIEMYTTNKWVTGGAWFEPAHARAAFARLESSEDEPLPLSWFKYILLLFQDEIHDLLINRDRQLLTLFARDREQGFLDRSIYYLSSMQLNLNAQLMQKFSTQ